MWRLALTLVAGGLLACVDESKSDVETIEGTWKVASHRKSTGETDRPKEPILLVFKGNDLVVKTKDTEYSATFSIDPTTTPKTIDLRGRLWRLPVTIPGCYQLLDGDAIQLRWSERGKRPSGFSSSQLEKGEREIVLIREKPSDRLGARARQSVSSARR
jgi:uncharacterized protein (TIGR03067 family)